MSGKEKKIIGEDEIELFELIRVIWAKRKFIIKVTGIFVLLGLFLAFTAKNEYKANAILLPESQEGVSPDLGGLGGLAGLAGFDLSGLTASGSMSPELYPEIISSTPFLNDLINEPIYYEKLDTTVSSFVYFKNIDGLSLVGFMAEYTIGLPRKIKALFRTSNEEFSEKYDFIRFSKEDWDIIQGFNERLSVMIDTKTGAINISAEMPDPVAAAKTADLLVNQLTLEITNYKTEKSKANLEFVDEMFKEAKAGFELKQSQLARYADRNRNISNSIVQTEYERLQNELDISFEVYKELATQLEQAKIKVKEQTPVFTVLEPVSIPTKNSKPNKPLILFLSIFLGLLVSVTVIVLKIFFKNL